MWSSARTEAIADDPIHQYIYMVKSGILVIIPTCLSIRIMMHFVMLAGNISLRKDTLFLVAFIYFLMAFLISSTASKNSVDAVTVHCTGASVWLAPDFSKADCVEANERFHFSDYAMYTSQRLEFSNRGTRRKTRNAQMKTPRRYTIGTCTIIVALLWDFPDQPPLPPLPGQSLPAGPFEKNVVTSFENLFDSAKRIITNCYGRPATPIGWESLGQGGDIGVFVMATESILARNIAVGDSGAVGMEFLFNHTNTFGNHTTLTS